jgi:hypothetical protein
MTPRDLNILRNILKKAKLHLIQLDDQAIVFFPFRKKRQKAIKSSYFKMVEDALREKEGSCRNSHFLRRLRVFNDFKV